MITEVIIYEKNGKMYCEDCKPQGGKRGTFGTSEYDHFCAGCGEDLKEIGESQQKENKYIRFNVSRMNAPTWVHIASEKPFLVLKGRYGRFSSTVCGKEYEMDDYSTVKDEQQALSHLCKQCAKQRNIKHQR